MEPIVKLSSHSNITALCTKYEIWDDVLEKIVKTKSIKLTNLTIPIQGIKGSNTWVCAKQGLIQVFKEQIVKNSEINALAAVSALGREKFAELIADSVIEQLKIENANRSWKGWIVGGIVMAI